MAELDEIEQVVRTRLRSLRQHAGSVARRARRPHQPQPLHHQPGRDRQAHDQPRRPAAAGSGPPGRPRRTPRRAQRRRRGHPPGAEQLGRAHDLDAEPTDRQHDRRQDAARTDPHRTPSSASTPVTTGSSSSRDGCSLSLGEREIIVETGEAAEFATMTPHAFAAIDGPAELIMIFDRDGQRAHVHHETAGDQAAGSPADRATPRGQVPVRSRCLHPGQQQGRRWPSSSSSWVRRMRRARVVACLASSTQQMNSLRARGVMSFQASSAVGLATSAFRRSAGSSCTTPPGTREALTEPR